jgi:RNA polymerase sigma-70 factor (ECF subfamily)
MREETVNAGQSFEAIVRRFEVPLVQYATRITGDRERARDVAEETLIKFERNGSVPPEKTATWLFTVCRNGALNVCRKEKRLMYLEEAVIESRAGDDPMPSAQLERLEAHGFLARIIATLPLRQQEVLQLKFQNDLSYAEIAEITKTTANSVGVLIHTALKTLRQKYGQTSKDFLPFEPRTN